MKPSSKKQKQQKRGMDFKKIRRKVGRKLPPPNNATNTEVKSKAIILPEQSVASDKKGLALSKKGLTLKELLQQTSHHNSKVRKDALIGIKDIISKYPAELKLHKIAVIEKLRERISDDDKFVRETLYQLLKTVIFPGCKEDNQGPFISLMMVYIFNAMTHLAIDIRLMAFKFLDLVVQFYPSSFSLYAEKILQNYEDILRHNQFYLQEKGKLKSALAGITRCFSLLPCNKRADDLSNNNIADRSVLHAYEPDKPKESAGLSVITKKLHSLLPILVGCFHDFIPLVHTIPQLDAQSFDCMLSVLKSVDLVVKFFVYGLDQSRQESRVSLPSYTIQDGPLLGQNFSPVLLKKLWDVFPLNPTHHLSGKEDDRYFILNIIISEIFLCSSDWIYPPSGLLDKFLGFIESALSKKICGSSKSGKAFHDKHLISLISFVPKLLKQLSGHWRSQILQAFTKAFVCCKPESSLKLACLTAIEELLNPDEGWLHVHTSEPEILDYQITWLRELPLLLTVLGDKQPLSSKAVLLLQLHLGQCALMNSALSQEYDNMQYPFREFFCVTLDDSTVTYGPFTRLSKDIQELSVCCLYYFSFLDSLILQSLASSCLCQNLEPILLFRIVEVLHSSYKAGRIETADHLSFFITLLSRYKVLPENSNKCITEDGKISNFGTFKSITSVVCSFLPQMGDDYLVFQMLEEVVVDQISLKPSLDNTCALLRMLAALDSRPTRLSEHGIINLSRFLPEYLIDIVPYILEDENVPTVSNRTIRTRYYLLPCVILFYRSNRLLNLVLNVMGSLVSQASSSRSSHQYNSQNAPGYSSRIGAIVTILQLIYADTKIQQNLLLCKAEVERILQSILAAQSSEDIYMTIEEKHKVGHAYEQLRDSTTKLVVG